MRPATARGAGAGRRASSPQVDPAMAARLKDLEAARKDDERQKKLAERKRAQELREAKKKLARELQGAQRMLTRSEQEVNKLTGQLSRTEQQAAQATVKKNREGEKAEEGIGRIRQKHGKVGNVLREKMANVGQARGRLAHVQFAMAMLERGVIVAVGEDGAPVQSPDNTMLNPQQQRRVRAVRRSSDEEGNPETDETGEGEEQEETEEDYDDGSAGLREELEQLKEENQKLREHLADADKRCTTAVQLLQQAQEVLETRMDDMSTIDFKIHVEREKEVKEAPDFENASTMQGSQDGSTQHSPMAQPDVAAPAPAPTTPFAAYPSLLGQAPPGVKRIPVYAGTLSPPPNRMVSCPLNVRYQPAQLPRQDATMPLGATLLGSPSAASLNRGVASMTIPSAQGARMFPAEPVAVPAFKPVAEPISVPMR